MGLFLQNFYLFLKNSLIFQFQNPLFKQFCANGIEWITESSLLFVYGKNYIQNIVNQRVK